MFDFISALPKVELHVHLVGSASIDTVLELARRHPELDVPTDRDALVAFYEFTDFAHFIEVYVQVTRLVTSGSESPHWSRGSPWTWPATRCATRRSRSRPRRT
ncbi:MAG: hypothetical protein ACRDSK_19855 [Actinophytocola sp.]|uniref:hypothetical protein n=1 Tax=Actinophytocola sp. TaxID=1872138 RepID=UPI003D6C59F6